MKDSYTLSGAHGWDPSKNDKNLIKKKITIPLIRKQLHKKLTKTIPLRKKVLGLGHNTMPKKSIKHKIIWQHA